MMYDVNEHTVRVSIAPPYTHFGCNSDIVPENNTKAL